MHSYTKRIELIRAKFPDWKVDAMLIGSYANRRWASGFSGSNGWLLISEENAQIGTDSRYYEQAAEQAPDFTLFAMKGRVERDAGDFLGRLAGKRLGIEANQMTVALFDQISQLDAVSLVKINEGLETLRQIKTEEEIATIKKSAAITDAVMGAVPKLVHVGMAERELAWKLEYLLREHGADDKAFPIIVASGPNGARAHHEPGDRQLQTGDSLIIDLGARLNGYMSDLIRTFYIGTEISERFGQLYEIVALAQGSAITNLRPGITSKEADLFARDIITSNDLGDSFGHGLGHGLGLEVHEPPFLSSRTEGTPLSSNMVVTIEPGVYFPDWGGIRIEDLVVIRDGGAELLSHCAYEPLITP